MCEVPPLRRLRLPEDQVARVDLLETDGRLWAVGLGGDAVHDLAEGRDGTVWLATSAGVGVVAMPAR